MSITAKSVIFDIADNWGDTTNINFRSVDFLLNGSVITVTAGFTAYATTYATEDFTPANAFNTSLSKTGSWTGTQWHTEVSATTNQRLIIVFDTPLEFDQIAINNGHDGLGAYTDRGIKNTVVTASTDAITDTTYNATIANSTELFDGVIREHLVQDIEDPQYILDTELSGSGTELDPYVLKTQNDMLQMREHTASYFELGSDITMSINWIPLLYWGGQLDGKNYRILNFTSSRVTDTAGFIDYPSYVAPLTLKNFEIHGSATGIVTSSAYYCGYLIAALAGPQTVTIEDCLVNGKYTPGGDRGTGVVGYSDDVTLQIHRVVANCTRVNLGRGNSLIFEVAEASSASGSYFNETLAGTTVTYDEEIGLTSAEFTQQGNFAALDFDNVWYHDGGAYPVLQVPIASLPSMRGGLGIFKIGI